MQWTLFQIEVFVILYHGTDDENYGNKYMISLQALQHANAFTHQRCIKRHLLYLLAFLYHIL